MTQGTLELQQAAGEHRPGRAYIRGEVLSFKVWRWDDHDWVIGRMCRESDGAVVRFVGRTMSLPELGCGVEAKGFWETHPEHGEQFVVSAFRVRLPRDVAGVVRYLAANVRGVGESRAAKVVRHFGPDAPNLIAREPERVREAIPRISDSMLEAWRDWAEMIRTDSVRQRLTVRLMEAGVGAKTARTIVRFFKSPDVAEIVGLRHPYRLLKVPGVGWRKADQIARTLGLRDEDSRRVCAGVRYALERAQESGHTALPADELARRATRLLELRNQTPSRSGIRLNIDRGDIRERQGLLYLPANLALEYGFAESLRSLAHRRYPFPADRRTDVEAILDEAKLSRRQREAVRTSIEAGASVLAGLPGSGKTTTLRTLLRTFEHLGRKVLLVAPTGKAASRAAQVTGAPASTIHRALGSVVGIAPDQPLPADVVIVDESGMVGLEVAHWLLQSIDPTRTQLVWVGDENQLSSVDHGFLLGDLIGSGVLPTSRLTEIFRQERDSAIVRFARAIVDGVDPHGVRGEDIEIRTLERRQELTTVVAAIDELVTRFGVGNVALLSPYRRRALGVIELNRVLQNRLNPTGMPGPYIAGGVRVRVGDRVIQTKNVYNLPSPVFNGETGTVRAVSGWDQLIEVDWGDRVSEVSGIHLMRLELAWATTVHRSQGSEYSAVLAMLGGGGSRLLSRQLLYTAATRAQEHLVVLEAPGAIRACLQRSDAERHTGLRHILREVVGTVATH